MTITTPDEVDRMTAPTDEAHCTYTTSEQALALTIANPCSVLTARNEQAGERIRPGRE